MSAADWRPTATTDTLVARAGLLARTRRFFAERGVLEVETPLVGRHGVTDVHLASIEALLDGGGTRAYLQTSPEYAMKRLLAAGAPDIYQICKAFRDGERGRHHNPEFTIVEWYRRGFDAGRLMDEVEALLLALLGPDRLRRTGRIGYRALVSQAFGLDPLDAPVARLAEAARGALGTIPPEAGTDRDLCLDLLVGVVLGPRLGSDGLLFVHDWPASQAALARLNPADPRTAARFEAYLDGIELCNGFHELTNPIEQRARFERDRDARAGRGATQPATDERLLAALDAGLPDCSGVALGFDRVVMLATGVATLAEAMAFTTERA